MSNDQQKRSWRTQKVILFLDNNLTEQQTEQLTQLVSEADDPVEAMREWFREGEAPQSLYNELNTMPSQRQKEVIDWQDVFDTWKLDRDIPLKDEK